VGEDRFLVSFQKLSKFAFEGEIKVSLHEKGDRVELAVNDTGTGIRKTSC
jgi:hypothetical protein